MMMTMTTTMMTMIQTSISGVDSTFDSLFRFFLVLACPTLARVPAAAALATVPSNSAQAEPSRAWAPTPPAAL